MKRFLQIVTLLAVAAVTVAVFRANTNDEAETK